MLPTVIVVVGFVLLIRWRRCSRSASLASAIPKHSATDSILRHRRFAFTIAKVIMIDLAELDRISRISSIAGLGVAL